MAAIAALSGSGFAIVEETTAAEHRVAGANESRLAAMAGPGAAELQQSRPGA